MKGEALTRRNTWHHMALRISLCRKALRIRVTMARKTLFLGPPVRPTTTTSATQRWWWHRTTEPRGESRWHHPGGPGHISRFNGADMWAVTLGDDSHDLHLVSLRYKKQVPFACCMLMPRAKHRYPSLNIVKHG